MGVESQIAAANAAADAAGDEALAFSRAAVSAVPYVTGAAQKDVVVAPIVVPPAYNPNVNLSTEFGSDFDSIWGDMEVWMRGLMDDWVNTHFPMLDPAIQTAENAWLLDVVNNGYEGIPAAVEAAMWDRARSKETLDGLRLEEDAYTVFSSRGFSMPVGILNDNVLSVQRDVSNKVSTISRDLAIKQVEIAIDMTKLAIGEMTKLRIGLAQALADFMRAWMTLPAAAAEVAKSKAIMQQTLWASSADYARAQVDVARLSLDEQMFNAKNTATYVDMADDMTKDLAGKRVDAALNAAVQMAKIASAARGAQNTLVGEVTNIAQIG